MEFKKEPQEIINKSPLLKLSDLKAEEPAIPFHKSQVDSYEIIEYPQATNGISYVKLFFDLRKVKEESLKNLQLFMNLLKQTDTKNYSFQELAKEINSFMGHISFHLNTYPSAKKPTKFKPYMEVHLNFLFENLKKNTELLKELLIHSQFSPKNRVQNLLEEMKTTFSNTVSSRARHLALRSAEKTFFPLEGAFLEEVMGGSFENYFLKSKIDFQQLIPQFQTLLKDIFHSQNLELITITTEKNKLKPLKKELQKFVTALPDHKLENQEWLFSQQKTYRAYAIPGEVQFVHKVSSFKDQGLSYSGSFKVYAQYLDTYFLHPRIREQAGAYGVWNYFKRLKGLWILSTYRDPNLKKTYEIFSQAVDFMKQESLDETKLRSAILGALKFYYTDLSSKDKANFMTDLYLKDLRWKDYIQTKKEILETKAQDLQKINLDFGKGSSKFPKSSRWKCRSHPKRSSFFKGSLVSSLRLSQLGLILFLLF